MAVPTPVGTLIHARGWKSQISGVTALVAARGMRGHSVLST